MVGETSYASAFDRALRAIEGGGDDQRSAAEGAARASADRLLGQTRPDAMAEIVRRPERLSPPLVTELLLRARRSENQAAEIARLALTVAQRLDPETFPNVLIVDSQAQSWAVLAEAEAASDRFEAADFALTLAEQLLPKGSGDPVVQGRVHLSRGSLLLRQGALGASLDELEQGLRLFRYANGTDLVSEALARQGVVLARLGRSAEAQVALRAGLMLDVARHSPALGEEAEALLIELARGLEGEAAVAGT